MKIQSAFVALLLLAAPAAAQSDAPADLAKPADSSRALTQDMSVSDLEDMDVYNGEGKNLADIENVVIGPDKKIHAVVGFGGFLGLGEEHRLVALDELTLEGDRLILASRTEDLKSLPAWDDEMQGYSELDSAYMAPIRLGANAASGIDTAPAATEPNVRSSDEPKPAESNPSVTPPDSTTSPAPAPTPAP